VLGGLSARGLADPMLKNDGEDQILLVIQMPRKQALKLPQMRVKGRHRLARLWL
jgi:hypothetical protein